MSHDFRGSVALVTGRGLGRVIAESPLAAVMVFLARSGFNSGQVLRMDGGMTPLAA